LQTRQLQHLKFDPSTQFQSGKMNANEAAKQDFPAFWTFDARQSDFAIDKKM